MKMRSSILALLGAVFAYSGQVSAAVYDIDYDNPNHVGITATGFNATGHTFNPTLSFEPETGTIFKVVDNQGLGFVTGRFTGLAHGQVVYLFHNGKEYPFVMNYYGGDGNDVVLHWEGTLPYAWGQGTDGKLGNNTTTGNQLAPVPVDVSGALAGKTVLNVACGGNHTLVLCSDGKVYAWGSNANGQLGINTTEANKSSPVAVNTTSGVSALFNKTVVAIAAGSNFSLALDSDGKVYAWGYNLYGACGVSGEAARRAPVAVDTTGTSALSGQVVVGIASGSCAQHSLVRLANGDMVAWGRNVNGCLGDGTTALKRVPTAVRALTGDLLNGKDIVSMAAGLNFTLALCSDGTLASWGLNSQGQLGRGDTTNSTLPVAVSTSAVLPTGTSITAISAGSVHSQALRSDGRILSWGRNNYDQLGVIVITSSNIPILAGGGSFTSVSAGEFFCASLQTNKKLVSWGRNDMGQLGIGRIVSGELHYNLEEVHKTNMEEVHKFVLCSTGDLYAVALIARPHVAYSLTENDQGIVNTDDKIDFGARHPGGLITKTFTIKNTGKTSLTGFNLTKNGLDQDKFVLGSLSSVMLAPGAFGTFTVAFYPQYKIGDIEAKLLLNCNELNPVEIYLSGMTFYNTDLTFYPTNPVPLTVNGVTASGNTIQISPRDIELGLFGRDITVIDNTSLYPIEGRFTGLEQGQEIVLTTASGTHSYAYMVNYYGGTGNDLVLHWLGGKLYGWGEYSGDGTFTSRVSPVPVDTSGVLSNKTIIKVCGGSAFSLALCSDGTLAAWGNNGYNQLGDNTAISRSSPVLVSRSIGALVGKTVIDIAAGGDHCLALCSDGTLVSWGGNDYGEIGDNTLVDRSTPVAVNAVSGVSALFGKSVAQISAGGSFSSALCTDGTVLYWGQIAGNNSVASSKVPVEAYKGHGSFREEKIALIGSENQSGLLLSRKGQVFRASKYPTIIYSSPSSALYGKTVKRISGGGPTTGTALCSDGTLIRWGENTYGQLGVNDTNYYALPVAVNTQEGVSALYGKTVIGIESGSRHALAYCSDGTLVSWGWNSAGQLGQGHMTNASVPVAVNNSTLPTGYGFNGVVSAGTAGTLALVTGPQAIIQVYESISPVEQTLRSDNSSINWGNFYFKPNVVGPPAGKTITFIVDSVGTEPLNVTGINMVGAGASMYSVDSSNYPIVTVTYTPTATGNHNATLRLTSNAIGGLAAYDINFITSAVTNAVTLTMDSPSNAPLTVLPAHGAFTAAGTNLSLTLGFEPTIGQELMIVKNDSIHAINGYFNSWGQGEFIYSSHGSNTYYFIVNYYGGDGNDMVLVPRDTRAFGWGESFINLGTINGAVKALPLPTHGYNSGGALYGKTILSIATGGSHTLALCNDGRVYAWGTNSYGQLGTGTSMSSNEPVPVDISTSSVLKDTRVLAIAAGANHSLAMYQVLATGDIYVAAWGQNSVGQLGDASTTNRSYPVRASIAGAFAPTPAGPGVDRIYSISAGAFHSMALYLESSDNIVSVATWGKNDNNQLGRVVSSNANVPHRVNMGTSTAYVSTLGANRNTKAISAGGNHCLAIRSDGTVVSWGDNTYGQLGNNTLVNSSYAVEVAGTFGPSNPAMGISGGYTHSLAYGNTGIYGWGDNDRGQVNTRHPLTTPVLYTIPEHVTGSEITGVIQLSAGNKRSFIYSTGSVSAWGSNTQGGLGDNDWDVDGFGVYSYVDKSSPYPISRKALLSDEVFTLLSKGSSSTHTVVTAAKGVEKPSFVITYNNHVLDSMDTLSFGMTGVGSSSLSPHVLQIINTGTADITSSFSYSVTDDASPGDAFIFSSGLGVPLHQGASSAFYMHRNTDYPGVYHGTFSIYQSQVGGSPFYIDLESY